MRTRIFLRRQVAHPFDLPATPTIMSCYTRSRSDGQRNGSSRCYNLLSWSIVHARRHVQEESRIAIYEVQACDLLLISVASCCSINVQLAKTTRSHNALRLLEEMDPMRLDRSYRGHAEPEAENQPAGTCVLPYSAGSVPLASAVHTSVES
jgi:hypothetical protein